MSVRDFTSCSFCNEFLNEKNNNFYKMYLQEEFEKNGLYSRIIAKTKNFYILPMVGPLVPGYLLVVPKKHYVSFAFQTESELREAQLIVKTIREIFRKFYGTSVVFEHGALSSCVKGGCCSDHAHLHIVAVDTDIIEQFSEKGFEVREIEGITSLGTQKKRHRPYLYYENQKDRAVIMDVGVIESQYIRKLIAKKMDVLDRALWNENYQIAWMIEIVKKLKPEFDNLRGNGLWE